VLTGATLPAVLVQEDDSPSASKMPRTVEVLLRGPTHILPPIKF
jgi:hypothetical protein